MRPFVAVLVVFALLPTACSVGEGEPAATATPSASPTPTLSPTPRPTSTPLPEVEEPPASGGVRMSLTVSCDVGNHGVELRVRYEGRIQDTDEPAATITRARVFVNGTVREDSGVLSHRVYERDAVFKVPPSRVYSVQLRLDTWAAPQPRDIVQLAQCPPLPGSPAV